MSSHQGSNAPVQLTSRSSASEYSAWPVSDLDVRYIISRASGATPVSGFGAVRDFEDLGRGDESNLLHANFRPTRAISPPLFGVTVGDRLRGNQSPFVIRSPINIAPMSIGGINVTTARILGIGAAGLCYINSGEGGFGTHSEAGADTILQIGTAKIGMARYASSHSTRLTLLDEDKLLDLIARHPQIKLIQLKISQGAKPGAVMLPGRKLSPVVALIRGHTPGQQHISPLNHCEIEAATATESMGKLLGFITRIRSLTGLPVGIKLSMGSPAELADFTRLMAECDQYPDQITLDGADGGTSAAHDLIANYMGYGSVHSAVYCVDKLLKDHGLRQKVVVSASGKLYTPIRALQAFALGAQSIETARGFLIALGCNQCRQCHTEHCPYSLTSSEAPAYSELQERELAKRVSNYVRGFNDDIDSLTRICGLDSPLNVTVDHFRGPFLKNIVNEIEEILR